MILAYHPGDQFKDCTEAISVDGHEVLLTDSRMGMNLPFPVMLNPERNIELFLVFDFSSRVTEDKLSFVVRWHA